MAFYTELLKTIQAGGFHTFDATVLELLGKYQYQPDTEKQDPNGEVIKLVEADTVIAADVLIHKNGRETPGVDLASDVLVMKTEQLAAMPDDLQAALLPYERTPYGRRKPEETGVIEATP